MAINALGYIEITTAQREAWNAYAGNILGMQVDETSKPGATRVRIDERAFRIELRDGAEDDLTCIGWQVADKAALQDVVDRLRSAGTTVEECDDKDADARGVVSMIRAVDPGGYQFEVFYGQKRADTAFVSPQGASFVTGGLGLGHVVLVASDFTKQLDFYTNVLGFRISDTMRMGDAQVAFMRCNPRHHSLAIIDVPGVRRPHHFMVEVSDLDMVGHCLDRSKAASVPLMMDLGKHSNDGMVSFYGVNPSGFGVEYGCAGLLVDDATWSVDELANPSLWGHAAPAPSV